MNNEQDRKQLETALSNKSIVVNEGCFLLRIDKSEINKADFRKQCLFGDAFRSAYSQHLAMIPTSIFLPEMFHGKNIFMEHKIQNEKFPLIDTFLPHAFLVMDEHDADDILLMYDDLFTSTEKNLRYSDMYSKMKSSVKYHMEKVKRKVHHPKETQLLSNECDLETQQYLKENENFYTVIFFTQASSISLQRTNAAQFHFGDSESHHFVSLSNSITAKFDGYNPSHNSSITLSSKLTDAIKRELLTFTQLFVGFEKKPSNDIKSYIENIYCMFNDQLKFVECAYEENVESYALATLRLYLSRLFETDDFNSSCFILKDTDYKETIKQKILFQLLTFLDIGSCVNTSNLHKTETSEGKPSIVCSDTYTNPFMETAKALYENCSLITHILTLSLFFSEVKNRSVCQSCEQKICAVGAPSLLFTFSTNRKVSKQDRSGALLCFYSNNNFNKVSPLGNMIGNESKTFGGSDMSNAVVWEKHHRNLLQSLVDTFQFDLSLYADKSPTDDGNIDERAERILEVICTQLDNAMEFCNQFCKELDDDETSVTRTTNVETEIKNSYKIPNMYDKGFANILLGKSLSYILNCLLLLEVPNCAKQSVSDVFLKVRPLLLDNKSGFSVSSNQDLKNISLPKVAIKSYTSDGLKINVQNQLIEMYRIHDLITQVNFKCKSYLYGRYDENKNNGKRKTAVNHIQNMACRKFGGSTSLASVNNSFLHFKNFCAKQVSAVLGIEDDDYCRDVLNDIKDERLEKYASIFKYVHQLRVDKWSSVLQLVSVMKLLEYLKFQPSYDKLSLISFNSLKKQQPINKYRFVQDLMCDDFNKHDILYAQRCNIVEFVADISGKRLLFRKCSGRSLDADNELLNTFSAHKMHPGAPIFYLKLGEKNGRYKDESNASILTNFINQEQFKLEKDVAYISYIKKNKKQLYDNLFEMTFTDDATYIEKRYTKEILNEMMTEFDERFHSSLFANDNIRQFLRLVLEEYLNPDHSKVELKERRLKEVHSRVLKRKRPCQSGQPQSEDSNNAHSFQTIDSYNPRDEEEDIEYQFLKKRPKII